MQTSTKHYVSMLLFLLLTAYASAWGNTDEKPETKAVILVPVSDHSTPDKYHHTLCKHISTAVELAVKDMPIPNYNIRVAKLSYHYDGKPADLYCENQWRDSIRTSINRDEYLLAVIGHPYSDEALYFGKIYNENDILFITPTARRQSVTKNKPYVFSMTCDDSRLAKYLAYYLRNEMRIGSDGATKKLIVALKDYKAEMKWKWKSSDGLTRPTEPVLKPFKPANLGPIIIESLNKDDPRSDIELKEIQLRWNERYKHTVAKAARRILAEAPYPLRIKREKEEKADRTLLVFDATDWHYAQAARIFKETDPDGLEVKDMAKFLRQVQKKKQAKNQQDDASPPATSVILLAPPEKWETVVEQAFDLQSTTEVRSQHFWETPSDDNRVLLLYEDEGCKKAFLGDRDWAGVWLNSLTHEKIPPNGSIEDTLAKKYEKFAKYRWVVIAAEGSVVSRVGELVARKSGNGVSLLGPHELAEVAVLEMDAKWPLFLEHTSVCQPFVYGFGNSVTKRFFDRITMGDAKASICSALAYDAAWLVLQAVDNAFYTPEQIRTNGIQTPLSQQLRLFLADGKSRVGVSGTIKFNANGNVLRPGLMVRPEKGGPVPIRDALFASDAVLDPADSCNSSEGICRNGTAITTPITYVGLKVERVTDVDLTDNTFEAEFLLWFYNLPKENFDKWSKKENISKFLTFPDAVCSTSSQDEAPLAPLVEIEVFRQGGQDDQDAWILRASGRFRAKFDPKLFPFDSQQLKITFSLPTSATTLKTWPDRTSQERKWPYKLPGTWQIDKARPVKFEAYSLLTRNPLGPERQMAGSPVSEPRSNVNNTAFSAILQIKRYRWPYIVTLVIPLAIFATIGLLALFVPVRRFEVRISLAVTALLAMVVHHLSQMQPIRGTGQVVLGDLLFLVAYIMMSVVVLGVVGIQLRFAGRKDEAIRQITAAAGAGATDAVIETDAEAICEEPLRRVSLILLGAIATVSVAVVILLYCHRAVILGWLG